MTSFFKTFIPEERQPRNGDILRPGRYLVEVGKVEITTDKFNIIGEPECDIEKLRDWVDENNVLCLFLFCGHGVFFQRLYENGYKKVDQIMKDPAYTQGICDGLYRSPGSSNVRQYAITVATNERIYDEEATKKAREIFEEYATALGCKKISAVNEDNSSPWVGKKMWIEVKEQLVYGKKRPCIVRIASAEKPFVGTTESGPFVTETTSAGPKQPKGLSGLNKF